MSHTTPTPLTDRACAYLHANCAQCHINAGGGNSEMELSFDRTMEKMNLIGVTPLHHKFDLPDAQLIASGHPERSVLWRRINMRGRGQMPQLATEIIDQQAVQLFRDWIKEMKPLESKTTEE